MRKDLMDEPKALAIKTEQDGAIGWIILNRPDQINAISDDIRTGFPAALEALDRDPEIRVIVVRGAGERGFCVGADIKEQRPPESAVEVRQRMEGARWIESLDRVNKPVIAAIHGYCMGGGLELALACDIRFAASDAVFALPELGLGLIPGGGGTQRIARVLGLGRGLDFILTGDRVTATDARDMGLVTRLSRTPESLWDEVRELASRLADKPAVALSSARHLIRGSMEVPLAHGLNRELDLFALLAVTEDRTEAARAFKEKRKPRFVGK